MSRALPLLSEKLPKGGKGTRVIFSENAADNVLGKHPWVKNDRKAFEEMGCDVLEFDLRKVSKADFTEMLETANLIHFCGGSVMYLMSLLKKKGFANLISKSVLAGDLMFSGTSAGSMISAASLKLFTFDKDKDERKFVRQMKDAEGLGLTDFLMLPHANQKDFVGFIKSLAEHISDEPMSLIFINDDQAVWVDDGKLEILSV